MIPSYFLGHFLELLMRRKTNQGSEVQDLKNTMNEMKNAMESINRRTEQVEERICEVEDTSFEIIQSEENTKKIERSEQSLHELWNISKRTAYALLPLQKEKRGKKG